MDCLGILPTKNHDRKYKHKKAVQICNPKKPMQCFFTMFPCKQTRLERNFVQGTLWTKKTFSSMYSFKLPLPVTAK